MTKTRNLRLQFLSNFDIMHKLRYFILGLALSIHCGLFGQEHKVCGFGEIYHSLLKDSLNKDFEIQSKENEKKWSIHKSNEIITIPTVVHVIYRTATQNISNLQIQKQINIINDDYRKLNADTTNVVSGDSKADMRIEFRLATRDPQGNATTGITRTSTTLFNVGDFNSGTYAQIVPAWDRDSYMNIWVCEIGGGLAGFAFPPGLAGITASEDGIVIDYTNFGTDPPAAAPYNLGRTLTHEIGHWFNLLHPWNDNNGGCFSDDGVSDTPLQRGPVFGAFSNCNSPTNSCFSRDMLSNFMQWVDDRCMGNFTEGQKSRARTALEVGRASLLNSKGLDPVGLKEQKGTKPLMVFPNPNQGNFLLQGDFNPFYPHSIELFGIDGISIPIETIPHERGLYVSMKDQRTGIYLIKLMQNGQILMGKISVYP